MAIVHASVDGYINTRCNADDIKEPMKVSACGFSRHP